MDPLRDILAAALAAAEPRAAVLAHLPSLLDRLAPRRGRIIVVGAGKASAPMAAACEEVLGGAIAGGVVVVKYDHGLPLTRISLRESAHPVPDAAGVAGAEAIMNAVAGLGPDDLVLVCLSGGASALIPAPAHGMNLADKQAVTRLLLASGADIAAVNCVRRHLSRLKGGRLARRCAPARVATLAVSDVPGDDWTAIGSGPTVPDPTTLADAVAACRGHGVWERLPESARRALADPANETAKPGDPCFAGAERVLVASNAQALAAASARAEALGHRAAAAPGLVGEAREAARAFAAQALALAALGGRHALVAGGETTVTLGEAPGRGGRNQEFALAAAEALAAADPRLARRIRICAAGTDGTDGPTDAAGGLVDAGTWARARAAGRDPARDLARHDAHPCLAAAGDLLVTGPTRTNVMDVAIALIAA